MVRARKSVVKREGLDDDDEFVATPPKAKPAEKRSTLAHTKETDTGHDSNDQTGPSPMESLGSRSREVIQVIQKLEALCIDATLPSLPKFVIVGDQSAGKSSIIEAVCGISLPRSQGTCTRCPYQITTTSTSTENAEWSCTVTLHRKFEYAPGKAAKDTKFERWTDSGALNAFEFAVVKKKEELGDVLRRAQLAILNPARDPARFRAGGQLSTGESKLEFSPNIINLHIRGNGLPELSLFDLPGAINVHEKQSEQHLVGFVEQLTKSYLEDEKTLVLLAVSCDQDTENSTAFRFVCQCNALERCMGVLTKPDLLATHRQQHLKSMLNAEKFALGNSWFVTKQLSQTELEEENITHTEARKREKEFFATKQPWNSGLAVHASQFGIPELQDAISQKLTAHIIYELPMIMDRVEHRLREIVTQLQLFPHREKDPFLAILNEVEKITIAVIQELRGDGRTKAFVNEYKTTMNTLREQMNEAGPRLLLETPDSNLSEAKDRDDEELPLPKWRKGMDGRGLNSLSGGQKLQSPQTENDKHPRTCSTDFTLDEVRKLYEEGSGSGIPGQFDPKVTDDIILQSLQHWPEIVNKALRDIQDLFKKMLSESIAQSLVARSQTQFYREAKKLVHALFTELMNQQKNEIQYVVACETHRPITYAATLDKRKDMWKEKLTSKRNEIRRRELFGPNMPNTENLASDPWSSEINAMVTPLAYHQIAAERIVDAIATRLEFGLIHKLGERLRQTLFDGLEVRSPESCARLLAEDLKREERRHGLVVEQEKLEQAMEELRALYLQT